jgi:hypothetical protein
MQATEATGCLPKVFDVEGALGLARAQGQAESIEFNLGSLVVGVRKLAAAAQSEGGRQGAGQAVVR